MKPMYETELPKDNVFAMLAWTTQSLKKLGHKKDEIELLKVKVFASKDYDEACSFMAKYFPLAD